MARGLTCLPILLSPTLSAEPSATAQRPIGVPHQSLCERIVLAISPTVGVSPLVMFEARRRKLWRIGNLDVAAALPVREVEGQLTV